MRSDLDAHASAFLIHHMIEMAASQVLVHRVTVPTPEQVLEALTDMICHYLLPAAQHESGESPNEHE